MSHTLESFYMRKARKLTRQNPSANPKPIKAYYRLLNQNYEKAQAFKNVLPRNSLEQQILNNSFPNS